MANTKISDITKDMKIMIGLKGNTVRVICKGDIKRGDKIQDSGKMIGNFHVYEKYKKEEV